MASEIPIQNIYYLLCYAWDQLQEGEVVNIASEDPKTLAELFGQVLAHGTQRLVRRGFDRGYVVHVEETPRLRGRLNMSASMERLSWTKGRMVCEFDEMSHNVLHNRILKTTIEDVLRADDIDKDTRNLLHEQADFLQDIEPAYLTGGTFRRVHLHRNNRFYRFLLNVCELIFDSKLPEQRDGKTRFRDFIRDEKRMPYLFERFVRNFYSREQNTFRVSNITLKWAATGSEIDLQVLPEMRTDVSLRSAERSIILDCKFYKEAMSGWHGREKLHSANLYQLYSYLRNAEFRDGWQASEGMLLYPAVGEEFDFRFEIDGHPVAVASVNLDRPWREISDRLLQLLARHQTPIPASTPG